MVYSGKNEDITKRVVSVKRIATKDESIARVKAGDIAPNGKAIYLGKVVVDAGAIELPITIMYNQKYGYTFAIFPGKSKDYGYSITVNGVEESDKMKSTLDLESAAVQAFCESTGTPQSKRDGGGSCSSCKHRRYAELHDHETGEVKRHTLCYLNGMIVDKDWHKLEKHLEETDNGLVAKKEKSTATYEHAHNSPNLGSKNGRYKKKGSLRKQHTDEVVNCPYYGAWFKTQDEEYIKKGSRELPFYIDNSEEKTRLYINGSELLVDITEVIDPEKIERKRINEKLKSLGFGFVQIKKLAASCKDREAADKAVKIMKPNVTEETHELIVNEIMAMREKERKRKERIIKSQIKTLGYTKKVVGQLVTATKDKDLSEDQIIAVLNKMTPAIKEKTAEVLAKRITASAAETVEAK